MLVRSKNRKRERRSKKADENFNFINIIRRVLQFSIIDLLLLAIFVH